MDKELLNLSVPKECKKSHLSLLKEVRLETGYVNT